jgi:hypothetical protein
MRVRGADYGFFATAPLVPNYFLARRDLSHELLPEDGHVMNRCHVWITHPHEATVANRDSKLAVQTSLARLVRVALGILRESFVAGLINMTMHAIDRDDEHLAAFIIKRWMAMRPTLRPSNPAAQMKQEGKNEC